MKNIIISIFCMSIIIFSYNNVLADNSDEAIEKRALWHSLLEFCPQKVDINKLNKIFQFNSEYTDLQREDTLEELKHRIIHWKCKVYEVKKLGQNYYRISISEPVPAIINVTTINDEQNKRIHSLKTGSIVGIKGMFSGDTFMRNLLIDPATILESPDTDCIHDNVSGY